MEKINFEKLSQILFCILFAIIAAYLFFRYVLFWLLPFIIAWCVAMLTRPVAKKISEKLKLPKKLCSVAVMLITLAIFGFLVFGALYRLVYELQKLLVWIGEDNAELSTRIGETIDYFSMSRIHIPLLDNLEKNEALLGIREKFDRMLATMVSNALGTVSARIPVLVGGILSRLPSFFLIIIVTVIACFYFAVDLDGLHERLVKLLPRGIAKKMPELKKKTGVTLLKYLKSYLILLCLTFLQLFVGFSFLGVDYAFLLALIIAFVDILPVLGVGTVLIPWAAVLLLMKNYYLGFGLLILYAVTLIVRQFAEPKIVGSSLGLHPLLTLIAMYVGFEIFGILGMFMGPAVLMIIKPIFAFRERDSS